MNILFRKSVLFYYQICREIKKPRIGGLSWWELLDSNQWPSACKADALNQLS